MGTFFLDSARVNTSVALFYQDYTNVQKQNSMLVSGTVQTLITNTAVQENYGGELEVGLTFNNGLSANAYYAYVNNNVKSGGNGSYEQQGVSKHQAGASLNYVSDLSAGQLVANLNAAYRSKFYLDDYDAASLQEGYVLLNARIGIKDIAGTGLGAAIFGKNLTDKYYRVGAIALDSSGPIIDGVNPGGNAGFGTYVLGEPRTYGIEVSYKF